MCALDIDKPGGRGSSMALEHMCVSMGDSSRYTLIYIATFVRARARGETSATPPRTPTAHASATDRARSAAVRAGPRGGAYVGQVCDGGGVPRADVRVEGRRQKERLRAETATLGGGVKCSHASSADAGAPTHTHERAHARARGRGRVACPPRRHARTTIGVRGRACACTVYTYRPIPVCRSMAVRRGNRTRTHEAQRRTVSPAHTGTLVCIGETPTHTPPAHA
jgi:hypothetical protein